ncbi:MAG: SDR family NAD(P)-dependent oxidoreductase [Nocardioides sp.]
MCNLIGKTVAITGAGSGIGRALALECVRRGASVSISDLDEFSVAETERMIHQRTATRPPTRRRLASGPPATGLRVDGHRVHRAHLDVSDRDAVMRYADQVVAHFGRLNVMINNAGVSLTGTIGELSHRDMQWLVDVNLWGVIHGTQAFLPHLIASGDGHLVNISSLFGMIAMPGQSVYNATKYAVRGFTESVRQEMLVSGHPVRVSCVHPGGVKTSIARSGRVGAKTAKPDVVEFFDRTLARLEPAHAARIIVKGMVAGKPRILVGGDARVLYQLARLTGARYQDLVSIVVRRQLSAHDR